MVKNPELDDTLKDQQSRLTGTDGIEKSHSKDRNNTAVVNNLEQIRCVPKWKKIRLPLLYLFIMILIVVVVIVSMLLTYKQSATGVMTGARLGMVFNHNHIYF